jgi:hypothetical protein
MVGVTPSDAALEMTPAPEMIVGRDVAGEGLVDWFQGRILRGDQVVIDGLDGYTRTKPGLKLEWSGRIATHEEQMSLLFDERAENLTLEIVDGRRWDIRITDREGEFLASGTRSRS